MARVTFDPTTVDDATATFTVGRVYDNDGKLYLYCQVVDANVANGDVLRYTTTAGVVTNKQGGTGSAIAGDYSAAGVAVGVITANQYGFILVRGEHTAVKCETGTVAGDPLGASTTTDGRAVTIAAAVFQTFGTALANEAGNLVKAQVNIL